MGNPQPKWKLFCCDILRLAFGLPCYFRYGWQPFLSCCFPMYRTIMSYGYSWYILTVYKVYQNMYILITMYYGESWYNVIAVFQTIIHHPHYHKPNRGLQLFVQHQPQTKYSYGYDHALKHPPVITIDSWDSNHSQPWVHGWFMALLYPH